MTNRARAFDWLGRHLISTGGIGIIAAVLGIFVFILSEAWPLFREPVQTPAQKYPTPGRFAIGVDPYHQIAYVAGVAGVDLLRLEDGALLPGVWGDAVAGLSLTAATQNADLLALGTAEGTIEVARIDFNLDYSTGTRQVVPKITAEGRIRVDPKGEALAQVTFREDGAGLSAAAAVTESGRLIVVVREQQRGLMGPGEVMEGQYELSADLGGERPTQVLVDGRIRQMLVGTTAGSLYEWRLYGVDERPALVGRLPAADGAITSLGYILGEVSVAVGDATGGIHTWFKIEDDGRRSYRKVHAFKGSGTAITQIAASQRDKQFLAADAEGRVALHHMTSEKTELQIETGGPLAGLAFAPKADGILTLGADGQLRRYILHNPHPEISGAVLFGQVWYEGYPGPEYVWQSTGGTDEFESKLSLIPLIFGTAKGTLYAMIFALPLAVLAAIYTAEFATPRVRGLVKPTVEVMASLPSVILGFLAGLWLAPLLESHVIGTLMLVPVVGAVVIGGAWAWQYAPRSMVRRIAGLGEIFLLCGVTLIGAWMAYALGPAFERTSFDGQFLQWLRQDAAISYDQRNCLVVGFAMGFAVIPLVFTICEDSLSSVPSSLRAGSLALGATAWQTAIKVVLPMALPGIFSAAMIGFGRAIGETMIVLMATGNTPIMEWNVFNGMRTISANIAVEVPEAPHQGTLYRVLFLSGLLLFIATFCINSVAEVVRQRLRDKYNRL